MNQFRQWELDIAGLILNSWRKGQKKTKMVLYKIREYENKGGMNVQFLPTSILLSHSWSSETYKNIFMRKKKTNNA